MKSLQSILFAFILTLLSLSATAQNWDIRLLDKLNGPPNPGPDKNWEFVTSHAVWVDVGLPLGMLTSGIIKKDHQQLKNGLFMTASYISNAILTDALKASFRKPRPFVRYPDIIYKKSEAGNYSFPSGHTSSAFSTATSVSLLCKKWYVVVPAYAYAASVGYSRMYLGVHYPSDVLAGALIGSGTAYLNWKISQRINRKAKLVKER